MKRPVKRGGFLRAPFPTWAVQTEAAPAEKAQLAERAVRLFKIRKGIWRLNLALVGVLVVSHVAMKFVIPGFQAAEYLATELAVLEAATVVVTRRMVRREEALEREFSEEGR